MRQFIPTYHVTGIDVDDGIVVDEQFALMYVCGLRLCVSCVVGVDVFCMRC